MALGLNLGQHTSAYMSYLLFLLGSGVRPVFCSSDSLGFCFIHSSYTFPSFWSSLSTVWSDLDDHMRMPLPEASGIFEPSRAYQHPQKTNHVGPMFTNTANDYYEFWSHYRPTSKDPVVTGPTSQVFNKFVIRRMLGGKVDEVHGLYKQQVFRNTWSREVSNRRQNICTVEV